jgi:hypothetical protein
MNPAFGAHHKKVKKIAKQISHSQKAGVMSTPSKLVFIDARGKEKNSISLVTEKRFNKRELPWGGPQLRLCKVREEIHKKAFISKDRQYAIWGENTYLTSIFDINGKERVQKQPNIMGGVVQLLDAQKEVQWEYILPQGYAFDHAVFSPSADYIAITANNTSPDSDTTCSIAYVFDQLGREMGKVSSEKPQILVSVSDKGICSFNQKGSKSLRQIDVKKCLE